MVCDCDLSRIRVGCEMRAGPGVLGYWTTTNQNSFPRALAIQSLMCINRFLTVVCKNSIELESLLNCI